MDLEQEIIVLLKDLGDDLKDIVFSSVIAHIERAEAFFQKAEIEKDDQYYTDVIYRTNQAYEGILKITYMCFAGGGDDDECNLSTYQIEQYLEKKQIFNERIKFAFALYRKKWRNPSVHEYGLFFSKIEALLAITNVTSFVYVLLNQLAERRSTTKILEMILAEESAEYHVVREDQHDINDIVVEHLREFHKMPKDGIVSGNNMSQIIGAIKGYLEGKIKGLEVIINYSGADMVINYDNIMDNNSFGQGKIIIEVKNGFSKSKLQFACNQLTKYMSQVKAKRGILYFYSDETSGEYEVNRESVNNQEIVILKPYKHLQLV